VLALPRPGGAARGGAVGVAGQGGGERPAIGKAPERAAVALRADVIIPARDEEESIARAVAALDPALVSRVIVVDNGSRDRTAEAARRAGALVVSEPRRGYGAACLAGLAFLRSRPPDAVAFLDADLSEDPAQLPELLAPIRDGRADLVIGSRTLGEREAGSLTPVQAFGNRLATVLLRALFGARFTDLGPFRAIRWQALERLRMRDRGYGWTVEMQARAARAGLRCAEIPVRHRVRRAGRSKVAGTLRGVLGAGIQIPLTIVRVRLGG
jgi:glycosyltransferase involved in cell wall biosynthesis